MNTNTTLLSSLWNLGIAFVVLRLCGVIDWSWWKISWPFWVPVVLTMLAQFGEEKNKNNGGKN